MSSDVQREIGERLATELPQLDTWAAFICGCDPAAVVLIEGVPWVHCFEWGWHDPMTPHPDAEYWPANGETVLA